MTSRQQIAVPEHQSGLRNAIAFAIYILFHLWGSSTDLMYREELAFLNKSLS